jgi:hypothetical protein
MINYNRKHDAQHHPATDSNTEERLPHHKQHNHHEPNDGSEVAATPNADNTDLESGSSMFTNYNFENFKLKRKRNSNQNSHHIGGHKIKSHHGRGHGMGLPPTQQQAAVEATTTSSNFYDHNENNLFQANHKLNSRGDVVLNEQDDESPHDLTANQKQEYDSLGKYELDWFFLDKQGHLNIISYGNQTRSRFKYKTFMRASDDEEEFDSQLPYASSALYSQTHSRSKLRNRASTNTYYLNVLIESEDDEGVYQCINPDLPNFILRNVTVMFAGKNYKKNSA